MRTLRSLLVLVLALMVYGPADATAVVSSQSGCGLAFYECPEEGNWGNYLVQCQALCGPFSYPGGCGQVDDDPEFPNYVLWCYQPS